MNEDSVERLRHVKRLVHLVVQVQITSRSQSRTVEGAELVRVPDGM